MVTLKDGALRPLDKEEERVYQLSSLLKLLGSVSQELIKSHAYRYAYFIDIRGPDCRYAKQTRELYEKGEKDKLDTELRELYRAIGTYLKEE